MAQVIDRQMDKEAVVLIYNGILLNHKKEHIQVSANEVDKPRAYFREWNKSERERYISYSNAYICNPEKMVLKNLFTGQQWRNRHRE